MQTINRPESLSYQPLDQDEQEIRLVKLLPSKGRADPLHCSLDTVTLSSSLRFQSLSYAWGHDTADVSLKIGTSQLPITKNLEHALRAVRKQNSTISLWVDAICINQQDVRERNHQVRLMRDIFTSASTVNIWLGTGYSGVAKAFTALEQLAAGTPLGRILMAEDDKPAAVGRITEVFQYPWWQRLWVIQEALLAHYAVVYCGNYQIQFHTIIQAFELLWNEYLQTGKQLRAAAGAEAVEGLIRTLEMTVRRLHIIRNFIFVVKPDAKRQFRDDSSTWPFMLHTCSWSNVSDPRDKVYGALGLFSHAMLEPDYSLSIEAAYVQSTFQMFKRMGNLALLSQALGRISLQNGLPSWTPDWRRPSTSTAPYLVFHQLFAAAASTKLDFNLLPGSELSVNTYIVDEITDLGLVYDHQEIKHAGDLPAVLRPVLQGWMKLVRVPILEQPSFVAQFTEKQTNPYVPPSNVRGPAAGFQTMPQSQQAPLYQDADYKSPTNFDYAPQSFKAPFYHDADHVAAAQGTPMGSKKRVRELDYPQVQQSIAAPLYKDADYAQALSTKRMEPVRNMRPHAYRNYDNFSHTYSGPTHVSAPGLQQALSTSQASISKDYGDKDVSGAPSSELFWRLMCMDIVDCEKIRKHRRCLATDSVRFWEWLDWIYQNNDTVGIPQLHWHLNTHLQGKRMIRTKRGYSGLASKDVSDGDQICIFTGESYPYVIRPAKVSEKSFHVVTPCYVHGFMDGQMSRDISAFSHVHFV